MIRVGHTKWCTYSAPIDGSRRSQSICRGNECNDLSRCISACIRHQAIRIPDRSDTLVSDTSLRAVEVERNFVSVTCCTQLPIIYVPIEYTGVNLRTLTRITQVTNLDMRGPQSRPQFLHLVNIGGGPFGARIFDILFNTIDTICETTIFFSDVQNN
jgi:hypothetical protein